PTCSRSRVTRMWCGSKATTRTTRRRGTTGSAPTPTSRIASSTRSWCISRPGAAMPLIQVCLNGKHMPDRHPAVPITPEQMARSGRAAVDAGAGAIHVHPRDAHGNETLAAAPRHATLAALRAACPGVEISFTTGFWIERDVARRLARIAEWDALPDVCSVN